MPDAERGNPSPIIPELDMGFIQKEALKLTVQYRMTKLSWPASLASALGHHSTEQLYLGMPLNNLLVITYYGSFLQKIEETEAIISNGPAPSSELILAWPDLIEQAMFIAEEQDSQLKAKQALIDDPTGITLLALKLDEFVTRYFHLEEKMRRNIASLISGEMTFAEIIRQDVNWAVFDNLNAFAYMRAFDDFRRMMNLIKDGTGWADKTLEDFER